MTRIKTILLSGVAGGLAGLASTLFLYLLDWATEFRSSHMMILWGLPFVGFLIAELYQRFGKDVSSGHNLILDEIHDPKKIIPLRMAPLVFIGTVLTHLFGGSAGREGTAVQMGASLADQISQKLNLNSEERKSLLIAGLGAGFGSAIGAPFAGALFGMEVIHSARLKITNWRESLVASSVGYAVTLFFQAPHSQFLKIPSLNVDVKTLAWVAVAGALFGLMALFFIHTTHLVENTFAILSRDSRFKTFVGGVLLVFLYRWEGSYKFVGLGIPFIQEAFVNLAPYKDAFLKLGFTALTIGSGFKGGEFVPLVFMGTTLGSALSGTIPVDTHLLGALGFAAVFGAAAHTPIACAVMAIELFGYEIAPYAFVACYMAFFFSGRKSLYTAQKGRRNS